MKIQNTDEIVKLQERGQITIPTSIRDQYGLKKGAKLIVRVQKKGIVLEPLYIRRKEKLLLIADAIIGSVNLDQHPEWSTKEKLQKSVRLIRSEWK